MRTTVAERVGIALLVVAAGLTIGAASGINMNQVRTAAPGAVSVSGVAAAEGSSLAAARADHAHSLTGTLPIANGGTGNTSGLAATATALASNPTNCSIGQAAIGIAADGSAEGCFTPTGTYALPVATTTVLGGVKQGSNVTIDGTGVLSVAAPYSLPDATAAVTGGIRLTGDLGGTATSPTVPGLASRSGTGACGANTWASTLNGAAAPTCTQPAFSNLSGSASSAQLPAATTALGAVKMAAACGAGNHVSSIGAGGELTCTADAGGGGGSPGGSSGQVQYNNAGAFGGAARVSIDANGNVNYAAYTGNTDPAAPATDTLTIYAKNIAGRIVPKWIGPSGVDMIAQPHVGTNNVRVIMPGSGATVGAYPSNVATPAIVSSGMAISTALISTGGTLAQASLASTNLLTQTKRVLMTTGTTTGAGVYTTGSATEVWRGNAAGLGGFFFSVRFANSTNTANGRFFVGLRDVVTAPTNVDYTAAGTTTPGRIGVARTGTGNLFLVNNVSGTAPTALDLGANFAVNTAHLYELVLYAKPNDTAVGYRVTNLSTGNVTSGSLTTNIPASTTFLSPVVTITTNAAASSNVLDFVKAYLETDF